MSSTIPLPLPADGQTHYRLAFKNLNDDGAKYYMGPPDSNQEPTLVQDASSAQLVVIVGVPSLLTENGNIFNGRVQAGTPATDASTPGFLIQRTDDTDGTNTLGFWSGTSGWNKPYWAPQNNLGDLYGSAWWFAQASSSSGDNLGFNTLFYLTVLDSNNEPYGVILDDGDAFSYQSTEDLADILQWTLEPADPIFNTCSTSANNACSSALNFSYDPTSTSWICAYPSGGDGTTRVYNGTPVVLATECGGCSTDGGFNSPSGDQPTRPPFSLPKWVWYAAGVMGVFLVLALLYRLFFASK